MISSQCFSSPSRRRMVQILTSQYITTHLCTSPHGNGKASLAFDTSPNVNLQLIRYKLQHRTHITQHNMYKMCLADTDACPNCTLGCTDLINCLSFGPCQPVPTFWTTMNTKFPQFRAESHHPHHSAFLEIPLIYNPSPFDTRTPYPFL